LENEPTHSYLPCSLPFDTTETLFPERQLSLVALALLFDAHNTLLKGYRASFVFL